MAGASSRGRLPPRFLASRVVPSPVTIPGKPAVHGLAAYLENTGDGLGAFALLQNGVDLYKVQKLLGHKNIAMTQRYAHHYPESLRSSVEVLDACYKSATVREQCN